MKIHRIRLENYRGVSEAEIEPAKEGVTIVQGPNEVGKSSLVEAFDLIFRRKDNSRANRVQATQPKGRDVGPAVEIEITTGPYHLVYFKRWLRNRETRLEVLEPEKEKLVGDEAHERANEILEKNLDVDLWKALRVAQGTGIELPSLEGKNDLSQALDAAAGGEMVEAQGMTLYERVEDEYLEYWTKNGNPRKEVKEKRNRVEGLEEEVQELEDREQALEEDVERIEQIQNELDDLRHEEEELENRRDEWAEELERVERLEAEVEQAEERVEMAQERLDHLRDRIETRRQLQEEVERAREDLEDAEGQIEAQSAELEEAKTQLEEAKDNLENVQETHEEAAKLEELRGRDVEFHENRNRLSTLGKRLERVWGARSDLEEAREALVEIAVDDDLVDEIRDRTYEVQAMEERLEEGGPTVSLETQTELTFTVDGEEENLEAGEARESPVAEKAHVDVPDVVDLRVEAGTSTEELREELGEARADLHALLDEAGVDDLDEAITQLGNRNDAERDMERARERMEEALEDRSLDELEDEVAHLEAEVERYDEQRDDKPRLPEDLQEAQELHKEAETDLEEADEALSAAAQREEEAETRLNELQREHQSLETERRLAEDRLENLHERLEEARDEATDEALEEKLKKREKELEEAQRNLDDATEALGELDPESVRLKAENAREAHESAKQEISSLEEELTKRKTRVETRGGEGLHEKLDNKKLALETARRERDAMDRRARVRRMLYKVLSEERREAKEAYVQPLKKQIDSLGHVVFGPSFEVHLDEDLTIEARTLDGTKLPYEDLSAGAREQLSVLLRYACAKIVADEGEGVPLLLDDALGYADADRLEAMGAVLSTASDECQVLVLTCRPDRYRHVGGAKTVRMG